MAIQIIPNFRNPRKGILQEPDERLRKVSARVGIIDETILQVGDRLVGMLRGLDRPYISWLGMAAPQIGVNLRIVAIKRGFRKYQIMVNPEVLGQKWSLPAVSGCYSLPGLYLFICPYWLKVGYLDVGGGQRTEVFRGGMAVLLKQEIDHLNGRLISD
ncbi:MAG: hypothetical protein A3H88_03205 [Candidatus Blackburnbacteria bacterium RIFCSPLOWO2_02_FULL_44_9]|nr:MAG: hypothetical protein A3E16_00435 [Candidatus Blackburnbacteria bacterium RIFCSPHIGHO2_12_FULL_44_25]OGY16197.1 MAG: hypothetical protein A3H88_03205 [Candidatus Blackburnbacteria bacterium RIFCSPLOWO2_02_FULL_44_9]